MECQSDGKFQNIILEGDLNFADVDWNDIYEEENTTNQFGRLKNIMNKYFMEQIIGIPTRLNKILDVIVTNNVNFFSHHKSIINENFSDHHFIVSYLNVKCDRKSSEVNTAHL